MKLLNIFEVEKNIGFLAEYEAAYSRLKKEYGKGEYLSFDLRNDLFDNYKYKSGYVKATHTGRIKEGIELNELELSMVCDGGFSHFGEDSTINQDRTFRVVIYTD